MATLATQMWNVTPAQYAALEAAIKAALGVTITGEVGTQEYDGVTVTWLYDGVHLTITILHRMFYDPSPASIMAKISAAVNNVFGEAH